MNPWVLAAIEAMKLVGTGLQIGIAYGPTDKMKEVTQEIQKKRLMANEYSKQLRRLSSSMFWHKKQSVDALINLVADNYDADDIEDFRIALYERYPKRKHIVK